MAAFPTSSLLTTFDGPDELPISESGSWLSPYFDRGPIEIFSGAAYPHIEFIVNGAYWTRDVFVNNAEVWGCTGGGGLGAANESWRVALWLDDPALMTGYSSGYGGGIGEVYFLRKYNGGGSFDTLGELAGTPPDKLGLRLTDTDVEQWAEYGGVWNLIQSVADAAYRGPFYAAIELEEQGGTRELDFNCFGAGVTNRQHFYRWVKGDHRD